MLIYALAFFLCFFLKQIKAKLCQMSQNKVDVSDVESLFYASSVMISLGPSCKVSFCCC